jgi:nicotinamide mononucleotide transporter
MLESFWNQLLATSGIEWLGTVTGIIGVWLTIRERAAAWPILIVCYACYVFISLDAKLYAMMLSQAVFITISAYGWYEWVAGKSEDGDQLKISHTPSPKIISALAVLIVGTALFGNLLSVYTDSTYAYLDGFATVCAFVAQWMLARKFIETWICWVLSDIIFIGIFVVQGYWMSAFLFSVFICLALRGWIHWKSNMLANTRAIPAT